MRAFIWFLGLVALGFAAIALFTYPAWLILHPYFDFPFHRIGERIGMLALLVAFLAVARRWGLADRVSLGYGLARRAFLRELGVGALIGAVTMLDWYPTPAYENGFVAPDPLNANILYMAGSTAGTAEGGRAVIEGARAPELPVGP